MAARAQPIWLAAYDHALGDAVRCQICDGTTQVVYDWVPDRDIPAHQATAEQCNVTDNGPAPRYSEPIRCHICDNGQTVMPFTYQAFKWDVIAKLPQRAGWTLDRERAGANNQMMPSTSASDVIVTPAISPAPVADPAARIAALFPRQGAVPPEAEFARGGGVYDGGVRYLVGGEVRTWGGPTEPVHSVVCVDGDDGSDGGRRLMGPAARLDAAAALECLGAAVRAWDRGCGPWPTMRVAERIERVIHFVKQMKRTREEVVRLLMWEIGKTRADAEKEFDRTVAYVYDTVEALKDADRQASRFSTVSGILAQIRRSPLGPALCMGPFNYPVNETFTTLIPALIMGNPVVAKLPRFGVLCYGPLLASFAEAFPPGVVNIFNGDGRETAGAIVEAGDLAALAFIGSSRVANVLKRQHPRPNRLRCVLGLDAKNSAIVLPDADLDVAVSECVAGALSFNGQRCTGLKLIFVHRSIADHFVGRLADAIDALPFGMPWERGVQLTPLPEPDKATRLQRYCEDAAAHGARVVNRLGGLTNRTFYFPSVLYPVSPAAAVYNEEQFGPVVPVTVFDDVAEALDAIARSPYGQQASVFSRDPRALGPLIDVLANQVCRVNLNAQCQRGPDVYPFAGRKDSAEGTLGVSDALRVFSIRSMVAAAMNDGNREIVQGVLRERTSAFLNTDYIF